MLFPIYANWQQDFWNIDVKGEVRGDKAASSLCYWVRKWIICKKNDTSGDSQLLRKPQPEQKIIRLFWFPSHVRLSRKQYCLAYFCYFDFEVLSFNYRQGGPVKLVWINNQELEKTQWWEHKTSGYQPCSLSTQLHFSSVSSFPFLMFTCLCSNTDGFLMANWIKYF